MTAYLSAVIGRFANGSDAVKAGRFRFCLLSYRVPSQVSENTSVSLQIWDDLDHLRQEEAIVSRNRG